MTKKSETSRSFKCIGWLFTVVLLGGAIAVAVLIGGENGDNSSFKGFNISPSVGIIDTNPGKYKEGRFISSNTDKNGPSSSSKLLEVENPNAPNILTNNPDFFNDDFPPKNAGNISLD